MTKRKQAAATAASKKSKKDPQSASKDAGDPVAAFLAWCASVGLKHPKCSVDQLPQTGRGVIATSDIRCGDVVIEVPDDAVLMVENCRIAEELEAAGLAKGVAPDALLEVQGLILSVMAEKAAGSRSHWAPYLSFIPDDLSHMPMYWEDSQLRELQGTAALDKMEGKVQTPADAPTQVRMLWEEVAEPFIQEHPHCKIPTGDKGWRLYQWATAAVASYSFILGDDHYQAMVPFWDALNHITGAVNVRLHHEDSKRGPGKLQMIATRDIKKGEELVNNYGELSQAELLRGYGYVEHHDDANKHAHVQVPLKFVLQACAAVISQRQSATPPESEPEQGGEDSDGASDWGLDSDSDSDGGHDDDDAERQEGSTQCKAHATTTAASAGVAGHTTPADTEQMAAALSACGSMPVRDVRRLLRGVPGRLRFLRRVGLLPKTQLYKVYQPSSDGKSRPGGAALAESARILLLPYSEFESLRDRVSAWRPAEQTDRQTTDSTAAGIPQPSAMGTSTPAAASTLDGQSSVRSSKETVVDAGPVSEGVAEQVHTALRCVAQYMLGRYTCSVEEDEALVQQWAQHGGVGDDTAVGQSSEQGSITLQRLRAAVTGRLPEKRCLHALDEWWDEEGKGGVHSCLQGVVTECWSQPRPGMHGVAGAVSDDEGASGDEGSSDDEDDSGSGDSEEDESEVSCDDDEQRAAVQGQGFANDGVTTERQAKAGQKGGKQVANEAGFAFAFKL